MEDINGGDAGRSGIVGNLRPVGHLQVISHTVIEGEQRGRGTNLSTYVVDGGHSGSWE